MSYYPLTFRPEWVCDVKAQLVLHNQGARARDAREPAK